jgi:hypothetical protein
VPTAPPPFEVTYDRHGDYASEQWLAQNPGLAQSVTLVEFFQDRDAEFLTEADPQE